MNSQSIVYLQLTCTSNLYNPLSANPDKHSQDDGLPLGSRGAHELHATLRPTWGNSGRLHSNLLKLLWLKRPGRRKQRRPETRVAMSDSPADPYKAPFQPLICADGVPLFALAHPTESRSRISYLAWIDIAYAARSADARYPGNWDAPDLAWTVLVGVARGAGFEDEESLHRTSFLPS